MIFSGATAHAVPFSTTLVVGETPIVRKLPEANLLVNGVGFRGGSGIRPLVFSEKKRLRYGLALAVFG